MRIAVAGAGWFGCHIASQLLEDGHEVVIFESSDTVFNGASGINQNRLHQGFHYPRSYQTREQSKTGFDIFVEKYPQLSEVVTNNVYAIAKESSFMDFETYCQVMDATKLNYSVREPSEFGLVGMTGAITCDERLIATERARSYFTDKLAPVMRLGEPVTSINSRDDSVEVNGEQFDSIVSCTWGQLESNENSAMHYESCIVLLYKGPLDHPAITVVDGPFFSIYPFEQDLFTLTSVSHTPMRRHETFDEAQTAIDRFRSNSIKSIRETIESEALKHYPTFLDAFEYSGFKLVVKTKLSDKSDTRICRVEEPQKRVIEVLAGKIDSIFYAADSVNDLLARYK